MDEIDLMTSPCWSCKRLLIDACPDGMTVQHGSRTYCSLDCAVRDDQRLQAVDRDLEGLL